MLQKKCCFSNCSRRLDTDYNQFSTTNPQAEGTSMSNSTIKQGSNIVLCRRLLLINIEDSKKMNFCIKYEYRIIYTRNITRDRMQTVDTVLES